MPESSLPLPSSTAELYQPLPVPVVRAPRPRYWLHALLFLLTCFSTLIMGARMQYNFAHDQPALSFSDESIPFFPRNWVLTNPERILAGLPFAATLMLFFLAHEMGHYLYCRHYGIYATLPFFIPMPLTFIGTMGAVILIRSPIRSRTALFDIGIAGPIAGFLVAVTTLVISLSWSKPMPASLAAPDIEFGYPLIFHALHRLLSMTNPASMIAGLPLNRVLLHPVAIAAWVGMLATALNLLPGGQLDGGHIVFSISPQAHRFISRATILVLLTMAYFYWPGWIVWAILLQLSSLRHPHVAEWPRVTGSRAVLAVFALLMLVLTLSPAPLGRHALPEAGRDLFQFVHVLFQQLRDWLHTLRVR
jgi:membrane-associated protease RseP (regulator of RpoE activity)